MPFLAPQYLVIWTYFAKFLVNKIFIDMQAHPYFNPVRNAESSRTRAHWVAGACCDMVFVLDRGPSTVWTVISSGTCF